jgi:Ca2+-binding RTX toxin-like protein
MIKIKLNGKKGVDYNAYVDSYFSDFAMNGFPIFLGGDGQYDGKEIVLLDALESKASKTKVMVLDGKDFFYYFTGHTVSGTLNKVTLGTLGKSYNKKDGSFDTNKKGTIDNVSGVVEISGLKISNSKEVRGDLHNTIYGLMGGEHESGGTADASLLFGFVNSQGHKVKGTKKGDSYKGTDFKDKVNLDKGDDVLNGAGGNDILKGGKGKDTFVFDTALGSGNVDKITDFSPKDDTIKLSLSVFTELSAGKLDGNAFIKGNAASDADDRIVYDKKTGALSYDANGSGSEAAVQFANVGKKVDLSADDFLVF